MTYILFYEASGEAEKIERMVEALQRTAHSSDIRTIGNGDLSRLV